MINKYISQLNEAQQAPVFQKDGPMIIIAGAGSGKTRVLTVRISYLMSFRTRLEFNGKIIVPSYSTPWQIRKVK